MSKHILTSQSPTLDFEFRGDCYICISGVGSASIKRSLGGEYRTLTSDDGRTEFNFISDGSDVMFNSFISGKKDMKYRIEAETTSEVLVEMIKERK